MELLTLSNTKTRRGESEGWITAILHLAPARAVGTFSVPRADGTMREISPNVCGSATVGCEAACLNTAGHGGIRLKSGEPNSVQLARARKTRWYFEDRADFMLALERDVARLERRAAREGMRLAVRLNGTSDIKWESVGFLSAVGKWFKNIFARFPRVTFYDYTKHALRKIAGIPNYTLTFSLAESNERAAEVALSRGVNVAAVVRDPENPGRKTLDLPERWRGRPVVDGDANDLRFTDPQGGRYVLLRAKGKAKYDKTGFVHDLEREAS